MQNILFFHHSADMYGADKVLLDLVTGLDRRVFYPILLLPRKGPLFDRISTYDIETYIVDLALVSRGTLSLKGVISLPVQIIKSLKAIDNVIGTRRIDIVHSNTLAVLSGALWAMVKKIPHVWHVHEIISRPKIVIFMYYFLLRFFSDYIVCNSHATCRLLTKNRPLLAKKTIVIWNGLFHQVNIDHSEVEKFRQTMCLKKSEVLVALVGRFNRWKGQELLIEAADILWEQGLRDVHFLLVGSAPLKQDHFRTKLEKIIKASRVKDNITISDYCSDIWTIWHACDIVVVPSTEPEPFGMVAIEAMSVGKPVIAAKHGGLMEIIEDGKTGIFFEPGRATKLARAIAFLVNAPSVRIVYGENGLIRQQDVFTLEKFLDSFSTLYSKLYFSRRRH